MTKRHGTVFISGMQSGISPSPGLGVAKSLRDGFNNIELIGVDYSRRSLGLNAAELDSFIVLPAWEYIDEEAWLSTIREFLEGTTWLPTLDLEMRWASAQSLPTRSYLGPTYATMAKSAKPGLVISSFLPVEVPDFLQLERTSDWEIHEFCRSHNWNVFLKGPHYEAVRVHDLIEFQYARTAIEKKWNTQRLFLQKEIRGLEESVAFAAFEGELLGTISIYKTELSSDGKTWGGRISPLATEWLNALEKMVRCLGWTGGGEIELLRDISGKQWLIELNPRFPGWIHGGTLCGVNLPGRLVQRALRLGDLKETVRSAEFVRVTDEIPVNAALSLAHRKPPDDGGPPATGKYGEVFGGLLKKLKRNEWKAPRAEVCGRSSCESVSHRLLAEVSSIFARASLQPTPTSYLLPIHGEMQFSKLRTRIATAESDDLTIQVGYSVKTAPDRHYLIWALRQGFSAECISQIEACHALECGFRRERIILNGPGKFWPTCTTIGEGIHAIFADSLSELRHIVQSKMWPMTLGIRVRPSLFRSRFGIDLGDFDFFRQAAALLNAVPEHVRIGIHFHLASSGYGIQFWRDCMEAVLLQARALQAEIGRPIRTFDCGGGWFPADFARIDLSILARRIRTVLQSVDEVILEPGKALTQESMFLISRVLDVRRTSTDSNIVVDTSVNDFPVRALYPPRVLWAKQGTSHLAPLRPGGDHILGRICMEDDVLTENVQLPLGLEKGDFLLFLDMGAYNRSMAYEFGVAERTNPKVLAESPGLRAIAP